MKERTPKASSSGRKKKSRSSKGGAAAEETQRLVPAQHSNRPYFDVPGTSRRNGPIYHSEPLNYSRAGIGVVFRDADSSARALQELTLKKQERAERRRAGILLGLLIFMATTVHITTRSRSAPNVPKGGPKGGDGGNKIEYGGRAVSADMDSERAAYANSTAPRRDSILDHFADSLSEYQGSYTPFFFHVPRSGGQTVKDIVGLCLNKIQASEVGVRDGHGSETQLSTVEIDNVHYVNVDTTTKEGIERAAMMGFAGSQMAEMVTSSYFLNVARYLFSEERPGRAFIMMRHPVHRAISMYHYQKSTGEIAETVNLEEFARGNGIENNWMTRFLTNAMEGELKKSHLDQAKKILSKKFLVGFLDDAEESTTRLMKYMGWKYDEDETKALMQQDCVSKRLVEGSNRNPVEYELPKKGSQAHALISWQTQFDMKLYGTYKSIVLCGVPLYVDDNLLTGFNAQNSPSNCLRFRRSNSVRRKERRSKRRTRTRQANCKLYYMIILLSYFLYCTLNKFKPIPFACRFVLNRNCCYVPYQVHDSQFGLDVGGN